MEFRAARSVVTYLALGTIAGISFLMPDTLSVTASSAAPSGETATLTGIVRDFSKTHPDFDVVPAAGTGHYAGDLQLWLPGSNRPVHDPTAGYKVNTEWRDLDSREIAPHMVGVLGVLEPAETLGIRVEDKIEIKKDCQVDSFNSTRGLYGAGGNFGTTGYVSTNSTDSAKLEVDNNAILYGDAWCGPGGSPGDVISGGGLVTGAKQALAETHPMPEITVPDDFGSDLGDVTVDGVTVVWMGDMDPDDGVDEPAMDIDDLVIKDSGEVRVQGDLRVVCETLKIEKQSKITLAPGANLTLFVTKADKDVTIKDDVLINVAAPGDADPDTGIVTLNYLGTKKVKIEKVSSIYGTIIAPAGKLEVKDASHVFGAFVGNELKLDKNSGFHVDIVNGDMGLDNPALLVRREIDIKEADVFDGFDSTLGPYDGPDDGGTNWHDQALLQNLVASKGKVKVDKCDVLGNVLVGPGADPAAVIEVKGGGSITGFTGNMAEVLPIPVVPAPAMGVAYSGDVEYKDGTFSLSTDLHCKKFKMEKAVLEISGDVTIRSDGKGEIKKDSEIRLLPGASLTYYSKKSLKIEDKSEINMNTGDPRLVSIRRMSLGNKGKIEVKKQSKVCAYVMGAKTELKFEDKSEFFGSFVGDRFKSDKDCEIHIDTAYLRTCSTINDTPGAAGASMSGGITDATTFDQWYRDVLGVNQSAAYPITLTKTAGVWEYIDNDFTPIDDALLGNEGEANNNHFTYTIAAEFTYDECGGQFFEFEGGDGAWLYIGDQLVMDLGGVQTSVPQYVDVDRLGLAAGESHTFRLFYAQRSGATRLFSLRTNVDLDTDPYAPTVTAIFD